MNNEEGEISEILPGKLYLSDYTAASCTVSLARLCVRGVISLGSMHALEKYTMHADPVRHMLIVIDDADDEPIHEHFEGTIAFIQKTEGAVLVHCWAGISRSATIVMAYLIKAHGMSFPEASSYVSARRRCVQPNAGFLRQLRLLSLSLKSEAVPQEEARDPSPCPGLLLKHVTKEQRSLAARKCWLGPNCVCCACQMDLLQRWQALMLLRQQLIAEQEQ